MFTLGISYNDNMVGEPAESIGEIEITLNFNK